MNLLSLATLASNGVRLISSMISSGSENVAKATSVFSKGMEAVKTGIETAKDITPIATMLIKSFGSDGKTEITAAELEEIEAALDAEIEDYLTPMKPRPA